MLIVLPPGIDPVPPCVALNGSGQGNGLDWGGMGTETRPEPPDWPPRPPPPAPPVDVSLGLRKGLVIDLLQYRYHAVFRHYVKMLAV